MPTVPSEEEFLSWFDTLSNWGRWRDDDQLGTLNLVTPEKRRRAAALVTEGTTVSCSWDISNVPAADQFDGAPQRHMLATGQGLSE